MELCRIMGEHRSGIDAGEGDVFKDSMPLAAAEAGGRRMMMSRDLSATNHWRQHGRRVALAGLRAGGLCFERGKLKEHDDVGDHEAKGDQATRPVMQVPPMISGIHAEFGVFFRVMVITIITAPKTPVMARLIP